MSICGNADVFNVSRLHSKSCRDNRNDKELRLIGWIPVHFWSKEVLNDVEGCVRDIEELIIQSVYQ